MWKKYKETPLLTKLLVAMVIGILLGVIFGKDIVVIKPFGSVFLNLLKMAAIPLVVVNLISGISALDDPKIFGRVGAKIMLYYCLTTVGAITLGLLVGYLFQPGKGFLLEGSYDAAIETIPSLGATLVGLIPSNIFEALTNGSFDKIVVSVSYTHLTLPTICSV